MIADVVVRLDPRTLERVDEMPEDLRRDPEVVADVLERDDDLRLLRQRNQPLDPLD